MFSWTRVARLSIAVLLAFILFFPTATANAPTTTATWVPGGDVAYTVSLTYPQCPLTNGNIQIRADVEGTNNGQIIDDAVVYATIRKPDLSTTDVNFSNDGNGTYTYTYNFDQNGTYFIDATAFKSPSSSGDVNGYVYLNNTDFNITFINNGFSLDIGALGEIQNFVYNTDDVLVFDLNANTTIYYPSGSVADANLTMTQNNTGEYVRSFFGPSPAGNYSVTSTFQCGARYHQNTGGTFTVNAAASSGGGSSGGGDSGSGGGGGGGGAGGGAGPRSRIVSIDFQPVLGKGAPSRMLATVQNLTSSVVDYTLTYTIQTPSGLFSIGESDIIAVGPYGITTVAIEEAFMPLETGTYVLNAELFRMNTIARFDTYEQTYLVEGEHAVTLDVAPSSDKTAVGLSYPFSINLVNNGDFLEENVQLTWYLINADGEEYIRSTHNVDLSPNETASLPYSPFIPINSPMGLHQLVVEMHAYNLTQTATVIFTVSSPNDYYSQVIADLELRISQLDEKLDDLSQRGFDTAALELILLDIRTDVARAKGMLLAGEFDTLNDNLIDLSGRVTRLAAEVDSLEQQSPLLSREGLTLLLYIGAGLLLGAFAWLLHWLLEKERKERGKRGGVVLVPASPSWLTSLLGVNNCYILASEREKLKRKPLIDRIIGLMEGESSHDN